MPDGAKARLVIELTHEELKQAVVEYVIRRYPQPFTNKNVFFYVDGTATNVTAELETFFRIPEGEQG